MHNSILSVKASRKKLSHSLSQTRSVSISNYLPIITFLKAQMNLNNNFSDQQWTEFVHHHNELMGRVRDVMAGSQSEEPNDVQLIHQANVLVAPQHERMVNTNGSVNWFGGGIVTEAMQRLAPIVVDNNHYPVLHEQALENIPIEPYGNFMQPPVDPIFNMDNRQHLVYEAVESPSLEIINPGMMMGDINNEARPASRTSEDDDEVVYLGRVAADQERSFLSPHNNNGHVAGPVMANTGHTEHGNEGNVRQEIQAGARFTTANPFGGLAPPSHSPTFHANSRVLSSRRALEGQQGSPVFRRLERNVSATAVVEDQPLANNLHAGFENSGPLNPAIQPNYSLESGFNNAGSPIAHLSPPTQAADEDDDIILVSHCKGNQGASDTDTQRRSNNEFVEGRNMSNNRQSELGGGNNQEFPTFSMPSRDNPFANVPPRPIPPLDFAFPEGTLSYTVPVISLDQVWDRVRQRDEAIAGRGPPPPPLVPDGEAELCYLGTPGFTGLNVRGHNSRGDNNGGHNGGYNNGGQRNWDRFQ